MVLMCIVGELGSGKTLTLTYLAWKNFYKKGRDVYSNYNLYDIPHTKVQSLNDLEKMRDGFFAGDELWLWLDCLEPSSMVTKNSGEVLEAEEVYKGHLRGSNPNLLSFNDDMQNSDGEIRNARKREIKEDESVYKVNLSNRDVVVSRDHRFPVFKQKEIETKTTEELEEGDYLLVPKKLDAPEDREITPTEAQILGYIFTDGHIYIGGDLWGAEAKIDDKDKETLEEYVPLFESIGFEARIHNYPSSAGAYTMKAGHKKNEAKLKELKDMLDVEGVPKEVMRSDNEVLAAFLRGVFDGDGGVRVEDVDSYSQRTGKITLANNNLNFLREVKQLLLRFGIETNRIITTEHEGGDGHSFRLAIRKLGSIIKFYEEIGFDHPKRKEKLEEFVEGLEKGSENKCYGKDDLIPVDKLLPQMLDKTMEEYPISHLAEDCDTSKIVRTDYYDHAINRGFLEKILENVEENVDELPEEFYQLKKIVDSDVKFKKVQEIERIDDPDFDHLIEFEVLPNRNYLAEGIYVHNSRTSGKQMNKVTSDILLKSRKRGLTYCFSAQNLKQVDSRVRKVIDFTVYPVMKANEQIVQALVFQGSNPNEGNYMRTLRFRPRPVYKLYDSREEVSPLKQKSKKPFVEVFNSPRDLENDSEDYEVI